MTNVTATVLLGTTCLGAAAGLVGTWAVLRRRALTGDLISHAALPGLCAALVDHATNAHGQRGPATRVQAKENRGAVGGNDGLVFDSSQRRLWK